MNNHNVIFKKVHTRYNFNYYACYAKGLIVYFTTSKDLGLYFVANRGSIVENMMPQIRIVLGDDFELLKFNSPVTFGYQFMTSWHKLIFHGLHDFAKSYWNYDKKVKALAKKTSLNEITDNLYSKVSLPDNVHKKRFFLKKVVRRFLQGEIDYYHFLSNVTQKYNLKSNQVLNAICDNQKTP